MQATFKRAPTGDRGPPGGESITVDILTNEQLGPRQYLLPNGSLLCRDVPIARVGWMLYGRGETPIQAGDAGVAYVERTADELFSPATIGSFMAATVTDGHPEDDVVPSNWKARAKGFSTTNVRRGTGLDSDVLLADLVITDPKLIADIRAGKREVSCGYEADYFQISPGVGRQANILGNHIALVEKGRCGPRCAIGDRAHQPHEGKIMTQRVPLKTTRKALVESPAIEAARARAADAQAELDALEQEEAEGGTDGAVHVHIHQGGQPAGDGKAKTTDERLAAVEGAVTEIKALVQTLVPAAKTADEIAAEVAAAAALAKARASKGPGDDDGEDDEDKDPATGKTLDSAALATSYTKVLAQAEVLVPGFRMPTFDAAAKRKITIDQMCQARRKCLDLAYLTKDGKALIDGISGADSLDLEKTDCAAVAILFNAASGAKALANNSRAATGDGKLPDPAATNPASPKRVTFADVNKANAEFWAKQQSTPA